MAQKVVGDFKTETEAKAEGIKGTRDCPVDKDKKIQYNKQRLVVTNRRKETEA